MQLQRQRQRRRRREGRRLRRLLRCAGRRLVGVAVALLFRSLLVVVLEELDLVVLLALGPLLKDRRRWRAHASSSGLERLQERAEVLLSVAVGRHDSLIRAPTDSENEGSRSSKRR